MSTIYAVSTAPGRAGIAVVRVSGPEALASLQKLTGQKYVPQRQAKQWTIQDPSSGKLIDKALILFFKGPNSYTGEDTAEYHIHGGRAVTEALLKALSAQKGHVFALPGEFTRRAFENGRVDLTAAEAIADLINAETAMQHAQAMAQMGGALSRLYDGWREKLTSLLAYIEAEIEFPDEGLPQDISSKIESQIKELESEIAAHLEDNRRGERLRDGIHVAVIGAPNAGKSSLVNLLTRREVAIVSEHAGTTRDVIEVHLDIGGYPVILSDTAGLRPDQLGNKGQDSIESEGIRRALERAQQADIKLLLFDAASLPALDEHTRALVDENSILIMNKSDLGVDKTLKIGSIHPVWVSAAKNQGIDELINHVLESIKLLIGKKESVSLTRVRHRDALQECSINLARARAAKLPELIAEDIRLAVRALGRITGRVDVEDLLDVIFRDFCIGK
jgi:tRNA modification GTPase